MVSIKTTQGVLSALSYYRFRNIYYTGITIIILNLQYCSKGNERMKIFNKDEENDNAKGASAPNYDVSTPENNTNTVEAPVNPVTGASEPAASVANVVDLESSENEETLIATLEKLREEINALKLEKAHVIESEEKLRIKIESEIEAKRRNIEGLKAEIPTLKQRCERLANILQIPVCK